MHKGDPMPRLLPLLALLFGLCAAGLGHAQATPGQESGGASVPGRGKAVIVGGDRDYPPYEFLDADGQPKGYNVDLSRAIGEVMGMKVEFRLGSWSTMRHALQTGEVDILQGMSYSEARLDEVDFTPPHTIVNHAIFARDGTPAVATLEDLRGRKVIVHRGGIMHDTLRRMGCEQDLILTPTPADGLRLLASGEGDYAVVAMLPGIYIIRENHLDNLHAVARSVATMRYGYAVKKGNEELLARFSEGLAILRKTGRYDEIRRKWLGVLESGGPDWRVLGLAVGAIAVPLLLLLGGIFLWNRSLRRKVDERTASLQSAMEELSRNQQQLVQADKMAALGILVSGVAHEINNPGGLILLNLPLLKKAFADARDVLDETEAERGDLTIGGLPYARMREEIPRILEETQAAALRIKRIVNDLREFSRRDEAPDMSPVDLNEAVAMAVRLVETTIRKHTDGFSCSMAVDLPLVKGNLNRLEQVVVNLVLNACQALPDKSRAIEVLTSHDAARGLVLLIVHDEGTGIAPQNLPHLLDPFFTTKRASGGTGLGLSVSAGIIDEHGGSIDFASVPNAGTTVTVSLPAYPAARKEDAA